LLEVLPQFLQFSLPFPCAFRYQIVGVLFHISPFGVHIGVFVAQEHVSVVFATDLGITARVFLSLSQTIVDMVCVPPPRAEKVDEVSPFPW
jgi:hypothetical protein